MDNATLLQKFERHLQRRYPDRSTALPCVSDVKQFQKICAFQRPAVTRTPATSTRPLTRTPARAAR